LSILIFRSMRALRCSASLSASAGVETKQPMIQVEGRLSSAMVVSNDPLQAELVRRKTRHIGCARSESGMRLDCATSGVDSRSSETKDPNSTIETEGVEVAYLHERPAIIHPKPTFTDKCDRQKLEGTIVPHTLRPRSVVNSTVVFPIGPGYSPRQANPCGRHNGRGQETFGGTTGDKIAFRGFERCRTAKFPKPALFSFD
jgi:hypothetical protein